MKMPKICIPEKKPESWQSKKLELAEKLVEQNDTIIMLLASIDVRLSKHECNKGGCCVKKEDRPKKKK